jgi:hypothetical protein
MSDIDFTGWPVPPGFTTFEIVERIQGPILGTDGTVSYGAQDHRYGVGHTAHLPHGGRLTVTPGDRNSYTAAGYYLAAYDALDNWVWAQRFSNVQPALAEGRSQLRVAEYLYNATRNPYVGDGADGCLRSARIDQEEADLLDIGDPRRAYLHDSAEAWRAQADRLAATDEAPTGPRRPETELRGGGDQHGPRPGPPR